MGEYRVERATARRLAHLIKSSNPNAPAVKPRGRGGCPGGGGLEGRGRSRAGGLRSADRRGGTGRGGLAGALPPTIGPVQGPEADRRGRSVPDRRQSERPQSAEDTPARDGRSAIAGAAAQPAVCAFAAQAQEKISDGVVKIGLLEDMSSMPGRLSRAGAPLSEVIGPPLNYT